MIHFLTGKPGAGKGVVSINEIVRELVNGDRVIVTDFAVKLHPWVRDLSVGGPWGKGQKRKMKPERGLLAYLRQKYGDTFRAEERILVIPETESAEFYLHRKLKTGEWVKLDATRDNKRRVKSFETTKDFYSTLYITDEVWRTFGARDWQNTSEGIIFYAAQHRKFGDEWFLTAQHTKQIETALRQLAQDFWLVRNHGKMRVGPFRQPSAFSITVYDQAPTGSSSVQAMERRMLTLDREGLGGCFDTSGGTGVTGGRSADINEKKRGLPFVLLIAAVIGVGLLLLKSPDLAGAAARKVFGGQASPGAPPPPPPVPQTNSAPLEAIKKLIGDLQSTLTNQVSTNWLSGYVIQGDMVRIFTDYGIYRVRNSFEEIGPGRYLVDGLLYHEKKPEPGPSIEGLNDIPINAALPGHIKDEPAVTVVPFGLRQDGSAMSTRELMNYDRARF